MSEWRKVKLGEITDSCLGKMLDAAKNRGEYQPYLANLNVRWGYFDTDNLSQMKFEKDEQERYGINYGDLIICEGGEPGSCAIWKEQLPNMKIQKALHRVRPKEGVVDNFYLFYWFLLAGKKKIIDQYCTGATIKHLPGQKLKEVVVDLPPIDVQRRIAELLSRYDSLIENYQRQSKLLEEAAQRLYKEWFVDLRFPGHESTPIINGIPQGWQKGILNDIAHESGKKVDKKYRDDYECYLPIDCIPKHSLTYINPSDVSLAESSLVSFQENDIIFGAMRPYFHKVCFAQSTGLTRTTCFVLNSNNNLFREYLLMLLFDESTIKHATSISVGTTMPYTRWKEFKTMAVLIPDNDIIIKFGKRISLITNELKSLSAQIRNLSEARDRLLPKLMSAEIEV